MSWGLQIRGELASINMEEGFKGFDDQTRAETESPHEVLPGQRIGYNVLFSSDMDDAKLEFILK